MKNKEVKMSKRYCINCGWRVANRFCMKHLMVILLDRYCKFWESQETELPGLVTRGSNDQPVEFVRTEKIEITNPSAVVTVNCGQP